MITLWGFLLLTDVAAVAFCVSAIVTALRRKTPLGRAARAVWAVVAAAVLAALVAGAVIYLMAVRHGMTDTSMQLPKVAYAIGRTPEDQSSELSDGDVTGRVVVVYRFDCGDCHDAYDGIRAWAEAHPEAGVVWVSSRSDLGRSLTSRYGVRWVPSALGVSDDGTVVVEDLYADDLSGLDTALAAVSG